MDTAIALQAVTGALLGVVVWFIKRMSDKIDELNKSLAAGQVQDAHTEGRLNSLTAMLAIHDARITKLENKE